MVKEEALRRGCWKGRGMTLWEKARPDPPPKKLELFSYENNPYARIVHGALCELELPYILQNVGHGSSQEQLLVDASGSKEVQYLIDPNTGTQNGDYKMILSYLFQVYSVTAVFASVVKFLYQFKLIILPSTSCLEISPELI